MCVTYPISGALIQRNLMVDTRGTVVGAGMSFMVITYPFQREARVVTAQRDFESEVVGSVGRTDSKIIF